MKYLAIIALLAGSVFSAGPTQRAVDRSYEMEPATTAYTSGDTLAASDSVTLFSKISIDKPGEIILLKHNSITGTGADSIACQVRVDFYESSGSSTPMGRVLIDSITTADFEAIEIPLGVSVFGNAYTVKLVTYTGAGTQAILPKFSIVRRKPIGIMKRW